MTCLVITASTVALRFTWTYQTDCAKTGSVTDGIILQFWIVKIRGLP